MSILDMLKTKSENDPGPILRVYSIHDTKSGSFNLPFFQKADGEAIRSFQELTKDDKSMICKYPEDFDLYFVGEYYQKTGVIDSLKTPQHLVKAIQLKV